MAWKIFKWLEDEFVEIVEKIAEIGAEDVSRAAPRTDKSFLRKLPTREWGFEHCPAIPYWADEHGDPDLKHVLATIVKLGARGQEGIPTAYHGLSTEYTIDDQTHDAYEFLYDLPRPGSKDEQPEGTPRPDRLPLQTPTDYALSWTTYQDLHKESENLAGKFAATLTDPKTATELFWPTIANFGIGVQPARPRQARRASAPANWNATSGRLAQGGHGVPPRRGPLVRDRHERPRRGRRVHGSRRSRSLHAGNRDGAEAAQRLQGAHADRDHGSGRRAARHTSTPATTTRGSMRSRRRRPRSRSGASGSGTSTTGTSSRPRCR